MLFGLIRIVCPSVSIFIYTYVVKPKIEFLIKFYYWQRTVFYLKKADFSKRFDYIQVGYFLMQI